jgi:hypothetical protein
MKETARELRRKERKKERKKGKIKVRKAVKNKGRRWKESDGHGQSSVLIERERTCFLSTLQNYVYPNKTVGCYVVD